MARASPSHIRRKRMSLSTRSRQGPWRHPPLPSRFRAASSSYPDWPLLVWWGRASRGTCPGSLHEGGYRRRVGRSRQPCRWSLPFASSPRARCVSEVVYWLTSISSFFIRPGQGSSLSLRPTGSPERTVADVQVMSSGRVRPPHPS